MGFFSVNINTLYYEIGLNNKISFKHKILKDKVISIIDSINEFIPIQRAYTSRSEIEQLLSLFSGHYDVLYNNNNIGILAFNNNSAERNIYSNPNLISEIQVGNSLRKLINDTKVKQILPLMKMVYYFCLNITYNRNIYLKIF